MKKNKKTKRFALLKSSFRYLAAFLVIVGVLAWQADLFDRKISPGEAEDGRPLADGAEVVEVRELAWSVSRLFTGTLMPRETVELGAQISGEVIEVTVEAGARVEQGRVLLRIDPELPEARRAEAKAALEMAQANLNGTERLLSHLEEAAEANAIPQIEAIDAQRVRDRAARGVEQRRAALDAAESMLGHTVLSSPMSGIVIDTLRDSGDLVMPGQPVMLLYDPARLEVVVSLPAHLADLYPPGSELTCEIDALGVTVQGVVRTKVPQVDPATRTVAVKLEITPPPGAFPGMYVQVQLKDHSDKTLVIPDTAVVRLRGLQYVHIVNREGRVDNRLIRPGRRVEGDVEVLAGLEMGEKVLKQYGQISGGGEEK